MLALPENVRLQRELGRGGRLIVEVAKVDEYFVDRLAGPDELVYAADLVRFGHVVVEYPVAFQIAQVVGEPLVVALQIGDAAQGAGLIDDLRRQTATAATLAWIQRRPGRSTAERRRRRSSGS